MIDRKFIGTRSTPFTLDVEKGQLRSFAKAVGERNPIYTDENAAAAHGYASLPAPPTFAFCLNLAAPQPSTRYRDMGVDPSKLLHGEQHFHYLKPIFAGDAITLQSEIIDIYDKKNGALEFIVTETTGTNQNGHVVVKMLATTVVQH